MVFFPNVKINLGLNVVRKRADGYHDIETIFCPVDLADVLEFIPDTGSNGEVSFASSGIPVDCPDDKNLCVKAYRLLDNDFHLPSIDIHLHKIVPPGAGLGGGSSDAAFMLKYLNIQFKLNLSEDELCSYASVLGSDCAFFIKNRPLFGYERGNVFKEIDALPDKMEIIIVNPGIHVSTAEAYAGVQPSEPDKPLTELIKLPLSQWKKNIVNDFEKSVFLKHPEIKSLKDKLYDQGADYASMSGSGSSVYAIFKNGVPFPEDYFKGWFCWKGKIING
jgi:4-diphosphocytidyl-2-C-methyl-D-erythritol kinase